jgi:hypothetical protein
VKRRWNVSIWLGFLLVLAVPFAFIGAVLRMPMTAAVLVVTFALFAAGLAGIVRGIRFAWKDPGTYRGKIAGPILLALGSGMVIFFAFTIFVGVKRIPSGAGAPRVGQAAPDFTLPDAEGRPFTLSEALGHGADPGAGAKALPSSSTAATGEPSATPSYGVFSSTSVSSTRAASGSSPSASIPRRRRSSTPGATDTPTPSCPTPTGA